MSESNKKKFPSLFIKNLLISFVLLSVFGVVLLLHFVFKPDNNIIKDSWFNIEMIKELTTVEGKYHVVAVHEQEGNFLSVGKEYAWFEYDVQVDAGINMDQVIIENPTRDGIVKIHLPPSTIHSTKEIKESKKNPVRALGLLTKLTVEEENDIIKKATEKLKNETQMKEVLLAARENAKNILEQYVKEIGEQLGENYTIEWIEETAEKQTDSEPNTLK